MGTGGPLTGRFGSPRRAFLLPWLLSEPAGFGVILVDLFLLVGAVSYGGRGNHQRTEVKLSFQARRPILSSVMRVKAKARTNKATTMIHRCRSSFFRDCPSSHPFIYSPPLTNLGQLWNDIKKCVFQYFVSLFNGSKHLLSLSKCCFH